MRSGLRPRLSRRPFALVGVGHQLVDICVFDILGIHCQRPRALAFKTVSYCFCCIAATSVFSFSRHSSKCAASAPYFWSIHARYCLSNSSGDSPRSCLDYLRRRLQPAHRSEPFPAVCPRPIFLRRSRRCCRPESTRRSPATGTRDRRSRDRALRPATVSYHEWRRATSGVRRSLHSGERSPSSCTARPSVNQRGTR